MKNAIILHGTGSNPESFWHPYLKGELEKRNYHVWVPSLPNGDDPALSDCLLLVLETGVFSGETVVIGHSSGCPLALSVLQNINVQIRQTILVAGYARPKGEYKESEAILQDDYDWHKIRKNTRDIFFLNSDKDPWGCNDIEGRYMFDKLGGTLMILHGEGHMGSETYNQHYETFPFLIKLIELDEPLSRGE